MWIFQVFFCVLLNFVIINGAAIEPLTIENDVKKNLPTNKGSVPNNVLLDSNLFQYNCDKIELTGKIPRLCAVYFDVVKRINGTVNVTNDDVQKMLKDESKNDDFCKTLNETIVQSKNNDDELVKLRDYNKCQHRCELFLDEDDETLYIKPICKLLLFALQLSNKQEPAFESNTFTNIGRTETNQVSKNVTQGGPIISADEKIAPDAEIKLKIAPTVPGNKNKPTLVETLPLSNTVQSGKEEPSKTAPQSKQSKVETPVINDTETDPKPDMKSTTVVTPELLVNEIEGEPKANVTPKITIESEDKVLKIDVASKGDVGLKESPKIIKPPTEKSKIVTANDNDLGGSLDNDGQGDSDKNIDIFNVHNIDENGKDDGDTDKNPSDLAPIYDDDDDDDFNVDQDKLSALDNNKNNNKNIFESDEHQQPEENHQLQKNEKQDNDNVLIDPFIEESDSNFFAYFMFIMLICILAYVIYHNKTKVLALVLEGRRSSSSNGRGGLGRRKHTAAYRKLDSNLEEAITSSASSRTAQIIY